MGSYLPVRKSELSGYFIWLCFLVPFLTHITAFGTHLRAGEIVAERINCQSFTFRITVTAYIDTGSEINFGSGDLVFGDGSEIEYPPEIEEISTPELGPEVGVASYTTLHTFPGPGSYTISYLQANRNGGVLNMFNSVETRFYIETNINIDPFAGCSNTPRLLIPPIDKACTGVMFTHNPGAYDPDGDSLAYTLIVPFKARGTVVDQYEDPNSCKFYTQVGINCGTANEEGTGPPEFSIDPQTGTVTWNSPGAEGEYNIAFRICEYRNVNGVVILLGCVERDMQIIVEDCVNDRPDLIIPKDTCVEAGTVLTATILGIDPNQDPVRMEAFSEIFNFLNSPATFTPAVPVGELPPLQSTQPPNDTANLKFVWQTDCAHVKDLSYQVVFKITDQPAAGPKLVTFKVWNIKVVAPAPVWVSAGVDLSERAVSLQWEDYECSNAIQMQIWRRVDTFAYTPGECETGMPEFLGYQLIDAVDLPGASSYLDDNQGAGLSVGAAYCYRLVAVFPAPGDIPILGNLGAGARSYVSDEICIPPIEADAPVITHVSVEKTGQTDGQVRISWRSPFDINLAQFPKPFEYKVYRAFGFSGNIQVQAAHPGFLSDTTFLDTGIDTESSVFNYRVVLYTPAGSTGTNPVDTSDLASTVRLETKPAVKKIELNWIADVPWSNRVQNYPYHRIYRGPEGSTESSITLIDSVNVNQLGFIYIDSGQYQNTPLQDTELYCYRVMARGAYGNPDILEPLINFSQIICAQPSDTIPPCSVTVELDVLNCEDYQQSFSCSFNAFSNTLRWNRPVSGTCQNDVSFYKIYFAASSTADSADFELLATNVRDTFYIDQGLPSFARCYRIVAVDRSGNESEPSEIVCKDNCPYYELPNVFTPNQDGCNDLFSAFSDRKKLGEGEVDDCVETDVETIQSSCARFVRRVSFTVYNRLGKKIYEYSSGGERTIYIDWDGRDSQGRDLPPGVYYYIAEVTFETVNPDHSVQEIKGWVQLIR